MPRRRLPYLQREVARGRTFWYVRIGRGSRIRIRGDYGSPEFVAAYHAAIAGELPARTQARPDRDKDSLAWLIARYRESQPWLELKAPTRAQRERILKQVLANAGDIAYAAVTPSHIAKARDDRAAAPAQAAHFLKTLRHLFKWAAGSGYIDANPAIGVAIPRPKTTGHLVWSADDIRAFQARWPIGTKQRLALELLAHTGLRRGDVVRLGRQHIANGVIRIHTEKTGTLVAIPVPPDLLAVIEATPRKGLFLLETEYGQPRSKNAFGNWFKSACVAAGVPGTAHGIRKALATKAAESGVTTEELKAFFGWTHTETAEVYIRTANRILMAEKAAEKMAKANGR